MIYRYKGPGFFLKLKRALYRGLTLNPNVLYKYRDITDKHHRRLLFNQELYFSDLSNMNDPFEGVLPLQDISELSDEEIIDANVYFQKSRNSNWNEETDRMFREHLKLSVASIRKYRNNEYNSQIQNRIKNIIYNNFGVLSLSCDPLNYLMWSHYSSSHTGFCVGLNTKILMKYIFPALPIVVNYTIEKPIYRIGDDDASYVKKYLGSKGILWEYESEIRYIKQNVINGVVKFGIEAIDSIYLGYKIAPDFEREICDYFRENHPQCKIYKIRFSYLRYELEGVVLNS